MFELKKLFLSKTSSCQTLLQGIYLNRLLIAEKIIHVIYYLKLDNVSKCFFFFQSVVHKISLMKF